MKINHIHPFYADEKSRKYAVKKALEKIYTVSAAGGEAVLR